MELFVTIFALLIVLHLILVAILAPGQSKATIGLMLVPEIMATLYLIG